MTIGAFNLGNGIGAAVCGGVTDAGLGWTAMPLATAARLLIERLRRGVRRSVAIGVLCG
ncbi:MAG: hypothetical protein INR70_29850 [Parafilimonas terrae]|nr:hypothetical protein [Parafilimonas terrae]